MTLGGSSIVTIFLAVAGTIRVSALPTGGDVNLAARADGCDWKLYDEEGGVKYNDIRLKYPDVEAMSYAAVIGAVTKLSGSDYVENMWGKSDWKTKLTSGSTLCDGDVGVAVSAREGSGTSFVYGSTVKMITENQKDVRSHFKLDHYWPVYVASAAWSTGPDENALSQDLLRLFTNQETVTVNSKEFSIDELDKELGARPSKTPYIVTFGAGKDSKLPKAITATPYFISGVKTDGPFRYTIWDPVAEIPVDFTAADLVDYGVDIIHLKDVDKPTATEWAAQTPVPYYPSTPTGPALAT